MSGTVRYSLYFFTDPPTTEIYTLSLHDALPICRRRSRRSCRRTTVGRRAARRYGRSARSTRAAERPRSEEHTSELQSHVNLVCRLLLEKKKIRTLANRRACEGVSRSARLRDRCP